MIEKSLVLIKPDAVARGIVGEILHRFERAGLKIVGMKLVTVTRDLGLKHYNHSTEWKIKVGNRNIEECKQLGIDVFECFGTTDAQKIGEQVDQRNADFLSKSPVIAIVFEGPHAVKKIRSLVGSTFPDTALPGTIRGDFGADSAYSGMIRKRSTYNMIHASGEVDEAEAEIKLWFKKDEILNYKRVHEEFYLY